MLYYVTDFIMLCWSQTSHLQLPGGPKIDAPCPSFQNLEAYSQSARPYYDKTSMAQNNLVWKT